MKQTQEDLDNITRMEGRAAWADHVLNGISDCVREMKKARKKMADTQRCYILGPDEDREDEKDGDMTLNFQCLCQLIRSAAFMVNTTLKHLEKRVAMEDLDESILNPTSEEALLDE